MKGHAVLGLRRGSWASNVIVGIVGVDVVGQCVNLHLCVRQSGVLGVEMKTLPVKLLLTFTRNASPTLAMELPPQGDAPITSSEPMEPDIRAIIYRNDLVALRRHLAEVPSSISSVDSKGRNLLMIAASAGDARLEVVRLLIAHRADVNAQQYQGITALMFACMIGASLVALQLVAAKADTKIQDGHGLTASEYARLKGHDDLVALMHNPLHMLRANDVAASTRRATNSSDSSSSSSSSASPSTAACSAAVIATASALAQSELAAPGEPVLSMLPAALLEAAQEGNCDEVRAYIASGGHVDAVDEALQGSMLHAACSAGHQPLATLLLAARAAVNLADVNGCTALSVACFAMAHGSVQLLLDHAASVNCQDAVGLTPLMVTALSGSVQLTRSLLSAHASRDLRDQHGQTALMYAQTKSHLAVVALLKRRSYSRAGGGGRVAERRTTPEEDELAARAADELLIEEEAAAAQGAAAAARAKAKRRARKKRPSGLGPSGDGNADSIEASSLDPSSAEPSFSSDMSGAAFSVPVRADEYEFSGADLSVHSDPSSAASGSSSDPLMSLHRRDTFLSPSSLDADPRGIESPFPAQRLHEPHDSCEPARHAVSLAALTGASAGSPLAWVDPRYLSLSLAEAVAAEGAAAEAASAEAASAEAASAEAASAAESVDQLVESPTSMEDSPLPPPTPPPPSVPGPATSMEDTLLPPPTPPPPPPSTPPPPPSSDVAAASSLQAQLEALQLRLREQEERMLCVVCLERARSHVLLPCGHKCLCSSCVDTVLGTGADAVCPLCRTPIQKAQRVFDT